MGYTDPAIILRKRLLAAGVIVAIVALVWIGYLVYLSTTFHVVSTNPSISSVATVTPFLEINFNRELVKSSSTTVTSNPSIVTSYTISGKRLTVNLSSTNQNQKYTITLHSIQDTKGERLSTLSFSFTPEYVPENKLPTDQQNAILKQQTKPANKAPVTFVGTESLINTGISPTQVQEFKQAIQQFAKTKNITLHSVVIDQSSVTTGPLNNSGNFLLLFDVNVGTKTYRATIESRDLLSMTLLLVDPSSGVQVFDSGNVTQN